MPLTLLHGLTGAAAGATFYAIEKTLTEKPIEPEQLGRAALFGGIAGALPDILEPPLHRYHRRFFHSITTLAAGAYALSQVDAQDMEDEDKTVLKASLTAYLSHLLLDSRTPMGLPLLI